MVEAHRKQVGESGLPRVTDPHQTRMSGLGADPQRPFVSIIVPTFRDWEGLARCLSALTQQTYPAESLEILVVNKDPNDSPANLELPQCVRLLEESMAGSYPKSRMLIRERLRDMGFSWT